MTIEFVLVSYDRAWPPKASPHALDLHLYGEGIFWMNRVHKSYNHSESPTVAPSWRHSKQLTIPTCPRLALIRSKMEFACVTLLSTQGGNKSYGSRKDVKGSKGHEERATADRIVPNTVKRNHYRKQKVKLGT